MRKKDLVLLFAASATVLQMANTAQSGTPLVYAAELDENSSEVMESPTNGSDPIAADQYIALIAEAAQQATAEKPVYPSLLLAYSMHYTEMGAVLGAQEGNYLPVAGQLGTQTLADDFRIFAENFYADSKDGLDNAADFAAQAALLEAYTGEIGLAQKLIELTTQYKLVDYDTTATEETGAPESETSLETAQPAEAPAAFAATFAFSETVKEPASVAVDYQATIYKPNFSIDTLPWGVAGYQYVATSSNYMGAVVRVTKESLDRAYGYIEWNGTGLGWIDLKALKQADRKAVAYSAYLTNGGYEIDSLPWGESGYALIGYTSAHLGKQVDITFESSDGTYLYASANGSSIGWIDKRAFGLYGESKTSFLAGSYSIDTLPWGTPGYSYVGNANDYIGIELTVKGTTQNGLYALVALDGKDLGWIDKRALSVMKGIPVAYSAYITSGGYEIDSLPWGEPGSTVLGYTSAHLGKKVDVLFESLDGNYKYVSANGKSIGWVDNRAFGLCGTEKTSFIQGSYSIDTMPWGTPGYAYVGWANDYAGREVTIKGTTQNGLYSLVALDGNDLGWIDSRAIQNLQLKAVSYSAYITNGGYEVDSLPWGVPGYSLIGYTSGHLGKKVDVLYETLDGNYKYVSSNGKAIGWIDKRAFGLAGSEYTGYVQSGGYSIDSLPWGTPGYAYIASSNTYAGLELTVKGTTQNGQYALVALGGKDIGWIDSRAMKVMNVQTVAYKAYISGGQFEIDSLPWGQYGYKYVGSTANYVGVEVAVSKKTLDGNYLYASLDGKELGWIDKRAFGFTAPGYAWYITNSSASITNLPSGTIGSKQLASGSAYFGQMMDVIGQTSDGSQLWIAFKGQPIGWIRSDMGSVLNHSQTSYTATITAAGYSIDSLPWGTAGFYWLTSSSNYVGKTATISKLSANGAYAYITVDGNELGWIDIRAFAKSRVVYLDPGHGGYESGASYSGVQEKTINMEVANEVKANLERLGMTVIMSRTYDEYVSLLNRSAEVNESNAQIFVSIHHNAMPGSTTVNGIETYYYEYYEEYPSLINQAMHNDPTRILESAKLAAAIHDTLIDSTGATDRGIRRNTFSVLRETDVPAVLLELGYMSSPTELAKLTNDSYQTIMAKAIADGIVTYFK